ncbi:MAG: NACHT domain-containing protein [Chthoniobacterales bacterium]
MSGLAVASAIAAKKAIENVVEDVYETTKSIAGQRFKVWKTTKRIDSLYKKLKHIRFVKTIWQAEKEIDLFKFYYESKLFIERTRVSIHTLDDIPYTGNILIEGTVGQGKSIFLRYLVSHELAQGRVIPIFIQLMRISAGESLIDHILLELKNLGLAMELPVFEKVATAGKVFLFLDAFDEIGDDQQSAIVQELENFARTFEGVRIIVTSRPERSIAFSAFFRVFKLAPLVGHEYEHVIKRMAQDDTVAGALINGINHSREALRGLLTTPLMVALLMVRYKMEQSIPENEIAFYEGLFMLLLQRHDKSKGGYIRPRKSKLGDFVLQDIFSALCYLAHKNRLPFKTFALHSATRDAISITQAPASTDKVLTDIVQITCMVIVEGDEWRFVHKSVQEYHAAVFVSRQPDIVATGFYAAMQTRWRDWGQELSFLQTLDRYRFQKYFLIPQLRSALGASADIPASDIRITDEIVLQAVGDDQIGTNPTDPPRTEQASCLKMRSRCGRT